MTPADRFAVADDETPVVTHAHNAHAYFDWSWKGCGFGQLSFNYHPEKGWWCDTEMMGPESTRKLLHAFADFVGDQLESQLVNERKELEARRVLS